jgi:hypothetical protein
MVVMREILNVSKRSPSRKAQLRAEVECILGRFAG